MQNPNPNTNFQSRLIREIGVVLSNGTLFSKNLVHKRMHPNEHRNGHELSTKLAS